MQIKRGKRFGRELELSVTKHYKLWVVSRGDSLCDWNIYWIWRVFSKPRWLRLLWILTLFLVFVRGGASRSSSTVGWTHKHTPSLFSHCSCTLSISPQSLRGLGRSVDSLISPIHFPSHKHTRMPKLLKLGLCFCLGRSNVSWQPSGGAVR